MYGNSEDIKPFRLKKRFILPIMVLLILLVSVVGTRAWLRNSRSLQTVTAIRISDLDLKGPDDDTIAIDLDSINVSSDGHAKYAFSVEIRNANKYRVQLGYTTNLNLKYTIYPASTDSSSGTGSEVFGDKTFFYDPNTPLQGAFLTPDSTDPVPEEGKQHNKTYGTYTNVQTNAEPTYWQSDSIPVNWRDVHYYILDIKWNEQAENKETDMIYLTVGIDTKLTETESGGSQS